jgi:nitric oxide dioxygenase
VELIAQKHASLGVRAEHYPIVGEHLLGSIQEVLGIGENAPVIQAWAQAYGVLADILIKREAEVYREHEKQHGWSGFKPFVVRRKARESATITSLYLTPADGSPVQPFLPGQYVTVRVPGTWHATTLRNYSLSGKPGEPYYRISVKREPAASCSVMAPAGHVSNYLHDKVEEGARIELGPPCGEFVLGAPDGSRRPLVFISGGVGVTPVLSMLHAALARDEDRDVWFIHGALDAETHAFNEEVRALAAKHPRLRVHVRYQQATDAELQSGGCDSWGLIDLPLLKALLPGPDAEFYFCGPKPMMAAVYAALTRWGVAPERVRYEFFGPLQALTDATATEAAAPDTNRRPCCGDAGCEGKEQPASLAAVV